MAAERDAADPSTGSAIQSDTDTQGAWRERHPHLPASPGVGLRVRGEHQQQHTISVTPTPATARILPIQPCSVSPFNRRPGRGLRSLAVRGVQTSAAVVVGSTGLGLIAGGGPARPVRRLRSWLWLWGLHGLSRGGHRSVRLNGEHAFQLGELAGDPSHLLRHSTGAVGQADVVHLAQGRLACRAADE